MKIVTISDTHNQHRSLTIPDGDMIIHAGDVSGRGSQKEIMDFIDWYSKLPHEYKILIAGNHDWGFETNGDYYKNICEQNGIIYLNDSGCIVEGIRIWGSPITPAFFDWAFNRARSEKSSQDYYNNFDYGKDPIKDHWDLIPKTTDILITHGPPYGILDKVNTNGSPNNGMSVGCEILRDKIKEIKPKLHVFGHIHETAGVYSEDDITYVNASSLDNKYKMYGKDCVTVNFEKGKVSFE